jgi:hypothetical protein
MPRSENRFCWLESRKAELLPVEYFPVVFTSTCGLVH